MHLKPLFPIVGADLKLIEQDYTKFIKKEEEKFQIQEAPFGVEIEQMDGRNSPELTQEIKPVENKVADDDLMDFDDDEDNMEDFDNRNEEQEEEEDTNADDE